MRQHATLMPVLLHVALLAGGAAGLPAPGWTGLLAVPCTLASLLLLLRGGYRELTLDLLPPPTGTAD